MLPQLIWGLLVSQHFELNCWRPECKMKLSCILLVTQATANAGKEPTTTPVLVHVASPSYMHKIGGF